MVNIDVKVAGERLLSGDGLFRSEHSWQYTTVLSHAVLYCASHDGQGFGLL